MDKQQTFLCNISGRPPSSKSHNIDSYLYRIEELGGQFDKLEAVSTAGNIRPPYSYQWRTTTKLIAGDDDCYEGLGGTPLEAVRQLYKQFKWAMSHINSEEDSEDFDE